MTTPFIRNLMMALPDDVLVDKLLAADKALTEIEAANKELCLEIESLEHKTGFAETIIEATELFTVQECAKLLDLECDDFLIQLQLCEWIDEEGDATPRAIKKGYLAEHFSTWPTTNGEQYECTEPMLTGFGMFEFYKRHQKDIDNVIRFDQTKH